MTPLIVIIYSGGLDSTVLLYHYLRADAQVCALSIDYGQRHRRELDAAAQICRMMRVGHRIVDLSTLTPLLQGSSQTDPSIPVPEGHYTDACMKQTVVPNRNMLLLSVAVAWAVSLKAEAVAYAAHAGDHSIYPDCRPAFVEAMQQAIALCDWHSLQLYAPFLGWSKAEIVGHGAELGVPFAHTWSCYVGGGAPLWALRHVR